MEHLAIAAQLMVQDGLGQIGSMKASGPKSNANLGEIPLASQFTAAPRTRNDVLLLVCHVSKGSIWWWLGTCNEPSNAWVLGSGGHLSHHRDCCGRLRNDGHVACGSSKESLRLLESPLLQESLLLRSVERSAHC